MIWGTVMNNLSFLKKNCDTFVILIVYLILALLFLKFFQYRILGDEISYINIAHAYAMGHWGNAVNGYWSPLYSWLMVPFLFIFGFKPLYGVYISKIISIVMGLFTILAVRRIARIFNMDRTVIRVMLVALICPLVLFALTYNTPDLLLAFLLILYLSIIYDPEYSNRLSYGLLCGFIGALAYFTKSFAFPFFLVHFMLFNIILYTKSLKIEKKTILKNLFLGLTIFFVLSGLWIGMISTKYDKLTFSTAGEYNQALVGPEYGVNTFDDGISPIYSVGLVQPPNNDTTSIWGDITYFKMDKWSPLASYNDFKYEIELIISNIIYTFNIVESFMFLAILIVIVMVFIVRSSKIDILTRNILKYILLTMVIYMGGYCLIIPEWRYLWFIFILLTVSSFLIVDKLQSNGSISNNFRNILLILLLCSLIFQPALEISHFAKQEYIFYDLSNNLGFNYNVHGNLASNSWDGTLSIAYYLNSKYYGGTKKTNNTALIDQELISNNIDYYFVWNNPKVLVLKDYHEIFNSTKYGLVIYQRTS
jgi:4-amino-4-deoxy-L-arabinose transferase-like glycosyltransferase